LALKNVSSEAQLPPSRNSLEYHKKRANYQVTLWQLALTPILLHQPIFDHGWDTNLTPIKYDFESNADVILTACKYKKAGCKSKACKCKRLMMKCCGLCECFDSNNKSGQSSFSNKEPDYDNDGNKDSPDEEL